MPDTPRPHHVTVFGATGFTGRLVADYLAEAYPPDGEAADGAEPLRWAIAGRDAGKLEGVRAELGLPPEAVVVADAHDRASLAAMCRATEVVVTTVGPYAEHGSDLVAACAAEGTDYCDLSGEVPWMRRMIDRHHEAAFRGGTRIVHSCGFDSIPSDLGVRFLQNEARARHGRFCGSVRLTLIGSSGSFSGGTFASLFGVVDAARADRDVARLLANPYALNPPAPPGDCPAAADQRGARYDERLGKWTAPFVMASINTRIVRRTHALAGFPYGRDFCYAEAMATGRGVSGHLAAKLIAGGIGAVMGVAPVTAVVRRLVPDPGEGPDRAAREAGYFKMRLDGRLRGGSGEHDSESPRAAPLTPLRGEPARGDSDVVEVEITGRRDPGYGCTSRMLAECAVGLARTRGEGREGGVLTPAYALGEELLEGGRLERAGVSFRLNADR